MNKLMDLWNRFFGSPPRLLTALAVLGIVLAGGFKLLGDSTSASFQNAREVVQSPYP